MALYFLLETNSASNGETLWKTNFQGQLFFSHLSSNSCGVLMAYLRSKSFSV